jgi:hypothetical protein
MFYLTTLLVAEIIWRRWWGKGAFDGLAKHYGR